MCFSAEADLIGGLVVGAIGVDVLRHVDGRHNARALAALPLVFAVHQVTEAFVWWGLQGHVPESVGHVATIVYLLIAFVLLPVYVPAAIWVLEPRGPRRWAMSGFVALGAVVAGVLAAAMIRGPVTADLRHLHLAYTIDLRAGGLVVGAYVLATCGAAVFSGFRPVAVFGLINLVAVAALAKLAIDGFASLWCGWAALTSGAIALYLRLDRPDDQALKASSPFEAAPGA
jgi:hypothetical protein